jgi:hypothetical protein
MAEHKNQFTALLTCTGGALPIYCYMAELLMLPVFMW